MAEENTHKLSAQLSARRNVSVCRALGLFVVTAALVYTLVVDWVQNAN